MTFDYVRWANPYSRQPAERTTMREILRDVAKRHKQSAEDIRGDRRFVDLVIARHEFMYLAMLSGKSSPQVAAFVGGRDHTSVLHGANRHAQRLAERQAAA